MISPPQSLHYIHITHSARLPTVDLSVSYCTNNTQHIGTPYILAVALQYRLGFPHAHFPYISIVH